MNPLTISKSIYKVLISSSLALLLTTTGCQSLPNNGSTNSPSAPSSPDNSHSMVRSLTEQALYIQSALANKEYASIIKEIHPTRGVRFSMYAYVKPNSDKVFSRAQFAQYLEQSNIRFTWGDLDGTGELLIVPLPTYLTTWIDGKKFNTARITVNEFESRGNMINNVKDIYPKADIVDFYYRSTGEYSDIDWRGMRLVFDTYEGKRYLVAIVNDRWTV